MLTQLKEKMKDMLDPNRQAKLAPTEYARMLHASEAEREIERKRLQKIINMRKQTPNGIAGLQAMKEKGQLKYAIMLGVDIDTPLPTCCCNRGVNKFITDSGQ